MKTAAMRRLRTIFVAILVATLAGCVSGEVESLPPPPAVKTPPTSSELPDFSGTSIAPVSGKTDIMKVEVNGGNARISGRVLANGTPVSGARIRIERLVGEQSAATDVQSNQDGAYSVDGLLGGRYRVRAYRPPDVTMAQAAVFFLGRGEQRNLDLTLERYNGGTDVRYSITPDPPIFGQQATVVVSVNTRNVDSAGTARSVGVGGVPVTLITAGGRQILTPPTAVTDGAGRAFFTVLCAGYEGQGLTALLPDGSSYNVNVAACSPPPTTAPPATGAPPAA